MGVGASPTRRTLATRVTAKNRAAPFSGSGTFAGVTDLRPVPPEATTTRTCSLWVDGPFLRARFLPAARVELADAVENLEVSARLTGGEPHLAIIDLRGLHSQSAEARALDRKSVV